MPKRFKFTIEFEGDLDEVPGWGYSEADWHQLAVTAFLRQSHYNVSAKVIQSTDARNTAEDANCSDTGIADNECGGINGTHASMCESKMDLM